ncbi:hypothetical protein [Arcicella rigui]|uniref:DUF1640 domain-containing protein n=1 Tax=Arcicella rigui TaxID=797020 RepID=A0ABU5QCE7_9BACT|nr:hypothetical protein [Arcicella rigui]MEA5140501.1 hypothetical protein [Arcicella rigui]
MASIQISEIQLYNILKEKIRDQQAQVLTDFIESRVDKEFEKSKSILASKSDILELKNQIAENKSEIIKWMFIFWTSQLVAVFTFLKFFIK